MKNSKLTKTINFAIFLTYFAAQVLAFSGMVLCQGDDGHVAIEFSNGGHCTEIPFGISDDHEHPIDSDHPLHQCELGHCGDCEDIPLALISDSESLTKSTTSIKLSENRAPLPTYFTLHDPNPFPATILEPQRPLLKFPSFLRTTILLI